MAGQRLQATSVSRMVVRALVERLDDRRPACPAPMRKIARPRSYPSCRLNAFGYRDRVRLVDCGLVGAAAMLLGIAGSVMPDVSTCCLRTGFDAPVL
jgi:hypothetical protein